MLILVMILPTKIENMQSLHSINQLMLKHWLL
jgi:hypothetical protein